ncbi:ParB/RepB/Spo0J family partition protein [Streptomyces odontomachi]|uniref:ParB/RepB/Spo0J family partition protein n=1 Tax=Streptomyces odontomachi TaxID=2944940 RepID=UPI00210E40A7|nr:ParB/RepB/Spo0J family partition protein [Streptomyces sp. ODS25]
MPKLLDQDQEESFQIDIVALRPADSPRFDIDPQHVQRLAEGGAEFQPILVHRETMRVVDGMHRVHATILRNQHTLAVQWFDGDEQEAFMAAVEANARHGLPLSREERRQAVLRILRYHPDWSDRSIAKLSGLSAKYVAAIRRQSGEDGAQPLVRIGRDGRARPSSATAGRLAAADVIRRNPNASLREIARQSGISTGTARDVRRRLASGQEPVPESQRKGGGESRPSIPPAVSERPGEGSGPDLQQRITLLHRLRKDPALRLRENGRFVLQQLRRQLLNTEDFKRLAPTIPMHDRTAVAEILSGCAEDLMAIARELRSLEDVEDSLVG